MKRFVKTFIAIFFLSSSIMAQSKRKISYNLFNPVPHAMLREMETDRPDVTESPITIDAGHFQYEGDLFRLEREKSESSLKDSYIFNQANLKLGITRSTALQLVIQSFSLQRDKSLQDQSIEKSRGFGDLILRVKQNLMGNDNGNFSIALLPYVKFPTSKAEKEEKYEGGLIIPMALKVKGGWKLGMQLEADRLQDMEGTGMHTQILESFTVGHALLKKVDGIAETYCTYDLSQHQWNNYLNAALQFEIASEVKLDAGLNYGLQHDAMKSYFFGLSFRL